MTLEVTRGCPFFVMGYQRGSFGRAEIHEQRLVYRVIFCSSVPASLNRKFDHYLIWHLECVVLITFTEFWNFEKWTAKFHYQIIHFWNLKSVRQYLYGLRKVLMHAQTKYFTDQTKKTPMRTININFQRIRAPLPANIFRKIPGQGSRDELKRST